MPVSPFYRFYHVLDCPLLFGSPGGAGRVLSNLSVHSPGYLRVEEFVQGCSAHQHVDFYLDS